MISTKYSQNFIKDPRLIEEILKHTSISKDDMVVEIGPGKGIITNELSKVAKKVMGIEMDKELFEYCQEVFKSNPKVEIINQDFLEYQPPTVGDYKIFSNIPFTYTADIIRKITQALNPPLDTYLFIQKEAAPKFLGHPYAKESLFSLMLKPWFELTKFYSLERTDFFPYPTVDVVIVRILKRSIALVSTQDADIYRDFLSYTFSQGKPTIQESFKKLLTTVQISRLSQNLNFFPYSKISDLKFEYWMEIFEYFKTGVDAKKKEVIIGSYKKLLQQQKGLDKIHRTRTKINPYHRW